MPTLLIAWIATFLASNAVYVVLRETTGAQVVVWLLPAQILALAVLGLLCSAFVAIRGARRYVLALLALDIGYAIAEAIKQSPPYAGWERTADEPQRIVADALTKVVPAVLMVLVAVLGGATRRSLYLRAGDLGARAHFPILGTTTWRVAGPILALGVAVPLLLQLQATTHPEPRLVDRAVATLPLALFFAIVNAASEEIRFRAVPLAQLAPSLGPGHALLVTAVLFAIGHYYGHPSGAVGVASAAIAGLLWGKAMLDTTGLFWPWLTHGVQDVLILVAVAMAP